MSAAATRPVVLLPLTEGTFDALRKLASEENMSVQEALVALVENALHMDEAS